MQSTSICIMNGLMPVFLPMKSHGLTFLILEISIFAVKIQAVGGVKEREREVGGSKNITFFLSGNIYLR